ncbi:protein DETOXIFICATION 46, chloroplastic isoform X2 [Amaranthus tricolor]|uniref:protein DETOXIFICATION 46, chloroplastic isoform X2 n=1 Tax=Amaranthus tricolor TaxID=29722 RepID=UPI002586A90A|nr:protein DETOXIFICATION 46, chloroplastic isoform X2 [Amaranthus tricolor]
MLLNAMPPFSSFISVKPTTINPSSLTPITYNYISSHLPPKLFRIHSKLPSFNHSTLQISHKLHCILHGQELSSETLVAESDISDDKDEQSSSVLQEKIELVEPTSGNNSNQSLWDQMIEIIKFSGPATGLWICGPLMSLIDTAVIGQGSSIELAALGPGTVLCDYMSYVFMFLSIATSNMVATSLARQDEEQVQHQISILLFLGLACGVLMLGFTKIFGAWALSAFAGAKNVHLIPAADTYVQIRALAWPAILVGWVAQSASLGMKDSMGPLKALVIASVINGVGDIVLCMFLGYGIAGAAWATAVSQIVAAYTMIDALNKKGYNGFSIEIPTPAELQEILTIAAPVFITIVSKVGFYSLIIYFATSIGTQTIAAHQVLTQIFHMCAVWGEPLSQTAQSFMPELLYGVNRSLVKMHKVWVPFFLSLCVTPCILSCEGSLLAGRDLKFISSSMSACFALGTLVLLLVRSQGLGLVGCWCALVGFQWARFFLALQRLLSRNGILFSEDLERYRLSELKTA